MEPVNLSAQTSTHFWQVNKKKKNGGRLKAMFHSLSVHCHCVSKARTLSTITRQIIHSGPAAFTSSTAEVVEVLWRKYHRDLKTHYSLEKVNQARQEKYVEAKDWLKKETRSSFMAEKFKKSPAHKELSKICVEASVLHLSSSSCFSVSVLILNMLLKCIWILTPSWLDEVLIKYHMVQIDRPRIVPVIMLSTLWRHTTDARGKQDIRNVPLLIFTRETRVRRGFFLFLFYPPCPGKQSNLI